MVNKENFFKGGYLLQIFFMSVKTSLYLVNTFDYYQDVIFLEISCFDIHSCCHISAACRERLAQEALPVLRIQRKAEGEVREVKMACTVHVEKRQSFSCMGGIAILTFLTPFPMDTLVEKST